MEMEVWTALPQLQHRLPLPSSHRRWLAGKEGGQHAPLGVFIHVSI